MNLPPWKWTAPFGTKGKPVERYPVREDSPWIVNHGDYWSFRANCGGVTTEHSTYCRSELRELIGGKLASWDTKRGIHVLSGRFWFTHLPTNKPEAVCAQIHDAKDDVVMIRAIGIKDTRFYKLYVEVSKGKNKGSVKHHIDTLEYGQSFDITFIAGKKRIQTLYNNHAVPEALIKGKKKGCYFKAGCYVQSNTKYDRADDYAEVAVADLRVSHT